MPERIWRGLTMPQLLQLSKQFIVGESGQKGLRFAENSAFGPVSNVHKGKYHYLGNRDQAVDLQDWRADHAPERSGGPSVPWLQRTSNISARAKALQKLGQFDEVFGPGDSGHGSHVHMAYSGKRDWTESQLKYLWQGVPLSGTQGSAGAIPAAAAARLSAYQQAALDATSWAEGTWNSATGRPNYDILYGGGRFKGFDRHPDTVVKTSRNASAAAGAYQFMPDTWAGVSKQVNAKDFGPDSQDRAALKLMANRGVDPSKPLTDQDVHKLAPEWASFPTATGGSAYSGQSVQKLSDWKNFYQGRIAYYLKNPTALRSAGGGTDGGGGGGATASTGGLPAAKDYNLELKTSEPITDVIRSKVPGLAQAQMGDSTYQPKKSEGWGEIQKMGETITNGSIELEDVSRKMIKGAGSDVAPEAVGLPLQLDTSSPVASSGPATEVSSQSRRKAGQRLAALLNRAQG